MIPENLKTDSKVWHERFGIGTFKGYESGGTFEGYAIIEFEKLPGQSLIHRKRLIEMEGYTE